VLVGAGSHHARAAGVVRGANITPAAGYVVRQKEPRMNCPHCGHVVTPCINAQEGMKVRAWLCIHCGWFGKAIGRERLFQLSELDRSEYERIGLENKIQDTRRKG
jgi:predicted RNA-binding Zn-ribbon protein involved in translation (DUF1610 family)